MKAIKIPKIELLKNIANMKKKEQRLITISAIDEGNFFTLMYHFNDRNLIVRLSKKKPCIDSIISMYPSAELYEREIHDFFGIEFKGNPRLHEMLFLPEDWKEKPPRGQNE